MNIVDNNALNREYICDFSDSHFTIEKIQIVGAQMINSHTPTYISQFKTALSCEVCKADDNSAYMTIIITAALAKLLQNPIHIHCRDLPIKIIISVDDNIDGGKTYSVIACIRAAFFSRS